MPRQPRIDVDIHSDGIAIVALRGEHDLGTAPEITRKLTLAGADRNLLVDLTACTFLDSTVISALLRVSNRLHERGGLVSLVIPKGRHQAVRSIFELMSIERLLPVHETRTAALLELDPTQPATARGPRTRLRALSEIIDASVLESETQRRAG
jgi:anti-anti-sigma factor